MTNFNLDIKDLNKFIDKFRKNKEQAEKEVSEIDEKYRKLAEKEKKDLNNMIKRCQKEIDFWEKSVLARYSSDMTELDEIGEQSASDEIDNTSEEAVVADEDKVVDPIPEEVSANEDENLPELDPMNDPSVVVETINVEKEMEKAESTEDPFANAEPASGVEVPATDGDGWPDINNFIDEWK